jgi:uncharacterized protein
MAVWGGSVTKSFAKAPLVALLDVHGRPMVRSVTRFILCAAVMVVGISEAQVAKRIDIRKLTTDDLRALRSSAERGNARSMTVIGIAYAQGLSIGQDSKQALRWLQRASKSDDVAQQFLGSMLRNGRGVAQDMKQARALFAMAASQGNVKAQFDYASLCFNGEGGSQDIASAAKYFEIAARQGDAQAQHMIARMYQYGRGVVMDYEQATRWYESAAKQNLSTSIYALGTSYLEGDMGVKDATLGRKYLERAATLGDWAAASRIGALYLQGEGVEKNEAEAYKWYAIARELSGVDTSPSTAILEGQLKPMEVASAKLEASQWRIKNFGGTK